jgi:hypothetical protein
MGLSAGLWGNQDLIAKPFKPANLQAMEFYNISHGFALYTGTSAPVRASAGYDEASGAVLFSRRPPSAS